MNWRWRDNIFVDYHAGGLMLNKLLNKYDDFVDDHPVLFCASAVVVGAGTGLLLVWWGR